MYIYIHILEQQHQTVAFWVFKKMSHRHLVPYRTLHNLAD